MRKIILIFSVVIPVILMGASPAPQCLKHIKTVKKVAFRQGVLPNAPMFMGQIEQESRCNESVIAFDGGQGLSQFMPKTAEWIQEAYPELKKISPIPNPLNPYWAITAMIWYDRYLYGKVLCQDWHYALRAYNGGYGLLNKEIKETGVCDYEEVAKHCHRSKFSCDVNTSYPYKIFQRALKYEPYLLFSN